MAVNNRVFGLQRPSPLLKYGFDVIVLMRNDIFLNRSTRIISFPFFLPLSVLSQNERELARTHFYVLLLYVVFPNGA